MNWFLYNKMCCYEAQSKQKTATQRRMSATHTIHIHDSHNDNASQLYKENT